MKLILIVFVLLATVSVGFAARLNYSARYEQGIGGQPGTTNLAQQITDAHGQQLLANMNDWSNGRYQCSVSVRSMIVCKPVNKVQTKAQASQAIQDMRALVCRKVQECGNAS